MDTVKDEIVSGTEKYEWELCYEGKKKQTKQKKNFYLFYFYKIEQ